jgi:hypothetical protein
LTSTAGISSNKQVKVCQFGATPLHWHLTELKTGESEKKKMRNGFSSFFSLLLNSETPISQKL